MSLRNLIPCLLVLALLHACKHRDAQSATMSDTVETEISKSLSNQFVHTIGEDSLGHIWIGTFRGLNKYDSHDFHHYFASNDEGSVPDDQIRHIMKDSHGRLWIATVNGVCRYTDTDSFTSVKHPANNSRYIKEMAETSDGRIFFNNFDGSLMRYLPQEDSCEVVVPVMEPRDNFFISIHPDTDGKLWLRTAFAVKCYDPGTDAVTDSIDIGGRATASFMPNPNELWITGPGLLKIFDTRTRRFRKLPEPLAADHILARAEIEHIHPYGESGVLFMTASDGMYLYDRESGTVTAEKADGFPFEVPDFKISTIFTDSRGNLWFGSEDQGYAVHYHYKERFNYNNYLRSALEKKSVVSVAADSDNRMWIVTKRDGIYIYDPARNGLSHVPPSAFGTDGDVAPVPYHAYAVDDKMWVMLKNKGMVSCTFRDGKLQVQSSHDVWMPMQSLNDRDETLWVGTASPYVFYKRKNMPDFEPIQVFEGFCFAPALAQFDKDHILVLAFNQPIKTVNIHTLEVDKAPCDTASFASVLRRSLFIPTCVLAGRDSTFWIGTVANGLLRYQSSDGTFRRVEGMPCSDISSIEEDADGNLWVSTLHGLAKLDPATLRTELFYAYDGIGGNQFYDRSSAKMMRGTIVFGGTHGLTFFRPGEVSQTPYVPLLFEDLKIHNKSVAPEPGGNIERAMVYAPPVRLGHDQNSFSISFVALDFCENHRVPCQYRLDGVDTEWVDANDRHEASYANISPGHYRFEVRVPSGDGYHTIALKITIERAWWASWWAMLLYVITGLAIVYFLLSARARVQAERKAVKAAKLEKEQEQRINTMNMRFFANVSHEFRTPLTMISGPVSQLASSEKISRDDRNLLDIIRPNVDRMLQLVNQMLDFNKLENDALKLGVSHIDAFAVLRKIAAPFEAASRKKEITWVTYGIEDEFLMHLDEDKLIKIYTNLLSNALKFTPRGGTIKTSFDVVTDHDVRYAKIMVENTGQRIPDDKLEKIFERYYQLDNPERVPGGSGIGLYYARRLAELHHGTLKAVQPDAEGACFVLMLPIDRDAYSDDECASTTSAQAEQYPISPAVSESARIDDEAKALVLVVDDDIDIANYIKTLLCPYFSVVTLYDGEEAIEWLDTNTPALIISDVVMPGSDGLSLCRHVKDDIRLCHIPIILVTAKATVENQIEGLEANADGYITKPFDPNLMLSKIRSLLFNREKMRQIVNSSTNVDDVDKDIISPQDSMFLKELYGLMEKELNNSEIDVNEIARLMNMSRTKFYYKVKGLTGEPPSVFFKTYKLNRAAELIKEHRYTMSEISDMTGFSSLSHFSRSFKKQFGVNPSSF